MATQWSQAKAAAMTVLGSKAKIPDPIINPDKFWVDLNKASSEFAAATEAMEKKLVVMQNAAAALKNSLAKYQGIIDGSNFGLTGADADDAKLAKAQKILDDYMDVKTKDIDETIKGLNDIDKAVDNLIHTYERMK
jgi:hypothetical protein